MNENLTPFGKALYGIERLLGPEMFTDKSLKVYIAWRILRLAILVALCPVWVPGLLALVVLGLIAIAVAKTYQSLEAQWKRSHLAYLKSEARKSNEGN